MKKAEFAILGSGMAGCGAAHRFFCEGVKSVVFDKNSYHGGHTASFRHDGGFIFDDGPHISFTKNERLQKLFAESVKGEFETVQARVNNYWRGHWIKHPAQCNLHGLPEDLIVDVIQDFVHAQHNEYGAIKNYADWLYAAYGKTFAETFPMEYGFKYHTTTAENMTVDWLGPRMYQPGLDEVLRGALNPVTPDVHYVDHFRYPTHGGFVSFLDLFYEQAEVNLGKEVTAIDPRARELRFADGEVVSYSHLVSSVPLPALIRTIARTPADVAEAARKLAYTDCVLINVGVDRNDISEANWSYFYDRDVIFARLSFPYLLSPRTVPEKAGSVQVEIYFSEKYRPLDRVPDELIEPVVADLVRCGVISENDRILFKNSSLIKFANVIYDHDRSDALAVVHGYLDDVGLAYCGRYGEWGHQWTDEAFLSGENAAQKILDNL